MKSKSNIEQTIQVIFKYLESNDVSHHGRIETGLNYLNKHIQECIDEFHESNDYNNVILSQICDKITLCRDWILRVNYDIPFSTFKLLTELDNNLNNLMVASSINLN